MAACQVLPWPDCRGPSNTITHATPCEAAKPPKSTPYSFHLVFLLLKGSQTFLQAPWRMVKTSGPLKRLGSVLIGRAVLGGFREVLEKGAGRI